MHMPEYVGASTPVKQLEGGAIQDEEEILVARSSRFAGVAKALAALSSALA
jgi:hypothetical protein